MATHLLIRYYDYFCRSLALNCVTIFTKTMRVYMNIHTLSFSVIEEDIILLVRTVFPWCINVEFYSSHWE